MVWKQAYSTCLLFILVGITGLAGAVLGGFAVYQAVRLEQISRSSVDSPSTNSVETSEATTPQEVIEVNSSEVQSSIIQTVQQVAPAVVTVAGTLPGQGTDAFQLGLQLSSGSGVFITNEGHILTNNHVVEGIQELSIVLFDGSVVDAELIGSDPFTDLAVLKISSTPPGYASLGDSDRLNPGETVIAIGSPLGEFKNTVTVGVVSATGRSIDTGSGYQIEGLIQTDAAINRGNSGGPLINLAGEVIGVNTLVIRSNGNEAATEGLGFAVPANTARTVVEQIIQKGFFPRPYLGIRWQPINPEISAIYNLPEKWGTYVTNVVPGSPADLAGIQPGDIITSLGGVSIDENQSYINLLFQHKPGDQITIQIVSDGQARQVQVILGESDLP